MEKKKEYKYDAFISYRHCDLDKFVAENLHKILESYELPKNIKEQLGITGRTIRRVFRDQDELPLSSNLEDPIVDALHNTKYLIVICSPRLKDSMWCKKEIETFKKIRGRKNIFCVLIEGEPSESFPEAVLTDDDNKTLVEPLAADVRGESKKEVLSKIKSEKLRLIAPMYGLDYDDLKQRHKAQEQKRKLTIATIVACACLLFALYTSIMLIKINSQQKILKNHQALTLSEKAISSLKRDSRYDAIKNSYQALTKYEGVKMPYTSEAEYALSEALGVYDAGTSFRAMDELKTKGVVDYIKSNNNEKYILTYDESEELILWNSESLKKIATCNDITGYGFDENDFAFAGDNYFAYITKDGNISINSVKDGKRIKEIKHEDTRFNSVKGKGNTITYAAGKKLTIYNIKENKVIGSIEYKDDIVRQMYYSEDGKYIFVGTIINQFAMDKEEYITVHAIEVDKAKELNSVELNAGYINGMYTRGDNLYVLMNRTMGAKFNLLVASYNFKSDELNWSKTEDDVWGKILTRSFKDGVDHVVVVNGNKLNVLEASTGETLHSFDMKSDIIDVYSYVTDELYLVFNNDGTVNFVNMETGKNIIYNGKFAFNLDKYSRVTKNSKGYFLIPENENRVVFYEANSSKELKEEKIELEYASDDSNSVKDADKLKEKYNIRSKNLISRMFYNDDKSLLFVSYVDDSFAVYDTKTKELKNVISDIDDPYHYFGKDKYGRIYIGNITESYILDKNYNKVGHINGLAKLDSKKNKVIISSNSKYYSLTIYTLNDLLKQAKEYLK